MQDESDLSDRTHRANLREETMLVTSSSRQESLPSREYLDDVEDEYQGWYADRG